LSETIFAAVGSMWSGHARRIGMVASSGGATGCKSGSY
jgi:hypothetical protein